MTKGNGVKDKSNTIDYHAKLIIHGLPSMSDVQIDKLVSWLVSFKDIKKEDKNEFSKTYTCKLMK